MQRFLLIFYFFLSSESIFICCETRISTEAVNISITNRIVDVQQLLIRPSRKFIHLIATASRWSIVTSSWFTSCVHVSAYAYFYPKVPSPKAYYPHRVTTMQRLTFDNQTSRSAVLDRKLMTSLYHMTTSLRVVVWLEKQKLFLRLLLLILFSNRKSPYFVFFFFSFYFCLRFHSGSC